MITEGTDPAIVLMLTAADSPGDRVAGLGIGADDYLSKPFHFPELVLRVRGLARRRPTAHPRVLRCAGIELDPLRRLVTRGAQPRELSAKEFALLEALIKRPRTSSIPSLALDTASPSDCDVTVRMGAFAVRRHLVIRL
jgi:DNA-binding response OmpR family regulator